MMKFFLRHLEIYLSIIGVLVIFSVTALLAPFGFSAWTVAAVTAISVGIVHGMVFWAVRRRQQTVRREAIVEIQHMLKDLINNQLTVIQTMSNLREVRPNEAERACAYITRSVSTISAALHDLSEESLQRWQRQYDRRS